VEVGDAADQRCGGNGVFGLVQRGQEPGFKFAAKQEQGHRAGETDEGFGGVRGMLEPRRCQQQVHHGQGVGVVGQESADHIGILGRNGVAHRGILA